MRVIFPFTHYGHVCPACKRPIGLNDFFHTYNERGEIRFCCPEHCPVCQSDAKQMQLEKVNA
jgi:hypothetical protein